MKVSQFLLFLCFLLLAGCSSLEERQEKTSVWWNGFFGTGSGMVQNLKGVYDGTVRQIHAAVQIGKGAVDSLQSAAKDIQARVQKVQDGVEKIQEGKGLIEEGVRGDEHL